MFLTTAKASVYLRDKYGIVRSPRTLQKMRYEGNGPQYAKPSVNECLYSADDLDAWVEKITGRRFNNVVEEHAAAKANANDGRPRRHRNSGKAETRV